MNQQIERVTLLNLGDGLFADLISPYVDQGYVIHPVDRLGRVYEACRPVPMPPHAGERMAA